MTDAGAGSRRCQVAIVGAGPVGLTLAIDLGRQGIETLVFEEDGGVGTGSRAICYSRRTLEIWDRLGVVAPIRAKGLPWSHGRVFFRDREIYRLDLPDDPDHRHPPFINLQQHHLEAFLVEAVSHLPAVELRWNARVIGAVPGETSVALAVEESGGSYVIDADYVVACDGARSGTRRALGLCFPGTAYTGRYLIADVRMAVSRPVERWFWFDPPFNPGRTAILHAQPDNVWRVDLALGEDDDAEQAVRPEQALPRIRRMLGADQPFELLWISVYAVHCRALERFRHGRVLFAGDAAHLLPIFGVRGMNSGIQDADNLGWKLGLVCRGIAPNSLLDSYDAERRAAADENLREAAKTTAFVTPPTAGHRLMRDAVLALAERRRFARRLTDPRQTTPFVYANSPLTTTFGSARRLTGGPPAGAAMEDRPVIFDGRETFLLDLLGDRFTALLFMGDHASLPAALGGYLAGLADAPVPVTVFVVSAAGDADFAPLACIRDSGRRLHRRYGAPIGAFYLIRPDCHVAARWQHPSAEAIDHALRRATGGEISRPVRKAGW